MAKLESLIKFKMHELDEKRKTLSNLFKEAEQVELQIKALLDQLEREKKIAENDANLEVNAYFGAYVESVMNKVDALKVSLSKIEARILLAQDGVKAAYAEMKKVEITNDRRIEEEIKGIDKKMSDELDEIGLNSFNSNKQN